MSQINDNPLYGLLQRLAGFWSHSRTNSGRKSLTEAFRRPQAWLEGIFKPHFLRPLDIAAHNCPACKHLIVRTLLIRRQGELAAWRRMSKILESGGLIDEAD